MRSEGTRAARTIVITGASSGLGAALARRYAAPGVRLGLVARRAEPLQKVAAACERAGAIVTALALDVTDADGLADFLTELDGRHPIDLVIANAGIFTGIGSDGALETIGEIRQLLRVNLEAAIFTADISAELMRPRRQGHVAVVSSLAARQPLADAPVYSASKAGLMAYGEALRERLLDDGIRVSIVLPGHFESAQTAVQRGALPFVWSASAAADRIARQLDRGRTTIAFPAALVALIALGRCVPWRVRAFFGRGLRFTVDDPARDDD